MHVILPVRLYNIMFAIQVSGLVVYRYADVHITIIVYTPFL